MVGQAPMLGCDGRSKEPEMDCCRTAGTLLDQWQKVTFFTPKRSRRGVLKRNNLLSSGCLDSGHRSCWLRRRTRAAEVLTYADVLAMMETAGAGGRELGRRFTDSAGSRRQEQARGENAILRSERGAAEDGQHRQAAGSRGQQAGMAGAAGGTTSLFPLHKYICCGIRISSDNVSLQEQR